MRKTSQGIAPPAEMVAAVRKLVEEDAEARVAERLGVGVSTVTRLRAGLPVRAGTIALVEKRLAAG